MLNEHPGNVACPKRIKTATKRQERLQAACWRCLPNAVLKARMDCARVDVVQRAQLLDESQSLELRRVYDFDQQRMHVHLAMNTVADDLRLGLIGVRLVAVKKGKQVSGVLFAQLFGGHQAILVQVLLKIRVTFEAR